MWKLIQNIIDWFNKPIIHLKAMPEFTDSEFDQLGI